MLEDEGVPIGIVERISGKHYRQCAFAGESGHAGTTPLELRHDAFLGLADFALKATQHVATKHYGSMLTVGRAALHPGSFSVIPGRADFTLDFRSAAPDDLAAIEREIFALAEDIASTRGLKFVSRVVDTTTPVDVAPRLLDLLEEECRSLGYGSMRITSGAGHDAQILAGGVRFRDDLHSLARRRQSFAGRAGGLGRPREGRQPAAADAAPPRGLIGDRVGLPGISS